MDDRTAAATPSAPGADPDAVSLSPFVFVNALLRHRLILLVMMGLGLVVGSVVAMLQEPRFEATVRFVTSPGSMRVVAGVGTDMSPVQQRDPFDYYTSVLESAAVRDAVLITPRGDGTTIGEHLGTPGTQPDPLVLRRRLGAAQVRLDSSTRTRTAGTFPVLMIRASWTDAQMAADLANAYLEALADYDKDIRSSAAKEKREFIGKQVDDTFKSLREAEDALRAFKEANRLLIFAEKPPLPGAGAVVVPPELELRRDQLQREVTVQSELYMSLKKEFDRAKIVEQDEASGLVVIERASPPRVAIGTNGRTMVLAGVVVGGLLGGLVVAGLEIRRRADLSSAEAREFVSHVADVRQDFAQLRVQVKRLLSPESADPPTSPSEKTPDA